MVPLWVGGFLSVVVAIVLQAMLMLPMLSQLHCVIEPPQEVVIPVDSVFWTFRTREIDMLVENLRSKNAEIIKKQEELLSLEARLTQEKQELESLKHAIEASRAQLKERIIEVEQAETRNLRTLASTYSAMSPEAIIRVFSHLDDAFIVKILAYLNAEIVGAIFQAMTHAQGLDGVSPQRAARLSELIRLRIVAQKS
jgi:flagellar motility protein MotE (MotC chaperone)